jgi:hypothetical protein
MTATRRAHLLTLLAWIREDIADGNDARAHEQLADALAMLTQETETAPERVGH